MAAWVAHAATPFDSLTPLSPLGFGTVAVLGAGSVTIHPLGGRTAVGAVYLVSPDFGSPAQLLVRSTQPNLVFSVSLPEQFTVSALRGGDSMRVTALTAQPALKNTGPGSALTVTIGGTLTFTRSPLPGTYQGSFPVTVAYP
ncbi:MAG: DUF4402 domain-containing protein [Rubrivivax sp.]